jgi:predicted site-specific integrase-resolvase
MPTEDDALLTEAEMAALVRVSLRTARRWRAAGTGPPVLWAGGRPRYRRSEVETWMRRRDRPEE